MADRELTDAQMHAYFAVFSLDAHSAAVRAVRNPGLSPAGIEQTVKDRVAVGAGRTLDGAVVVAACENPDTPRNIVEAALEYSLRALLPANVADTAITHRHLGAQLGGLHQAYPQLSVAHMLTNPAAPPGFLAFHCTENPRAVLTNPNTSGRTIRRLLHNGAMNTRIWGAHLVDLDHPLYEQATTSPMPEIRANAYRNPRLGTAELRDTLTAELDRGSTGTEATHVLCARLGVHLVENPFDEQAQNLLHERAIRAPRPELAAAAGALTENMRTAAHRLLRTGFAGTAGELFDVAATFEDQATADGT